MKKAFHGLTFILTLSLFMISDAVSKDWNRAMANALKVGNIPQAQILFKALHSGIPVPRAFSNVVSELNTPIPDTNNLPLALGIFEDSLNAGFVGSGIGNYLSVISDPNSPLEVRIKLFWVARNRALKFKASEKNPISDALIRIVKASSAPAHLRATILRNLAGEPFNHDLNIFLTFANAEESFLREAACEGLSRIIHENRASGRKAANASLFGRLSAGAADDLDTNEVRVFASFGEEYSRNYLLGRCAGSPEKIIALLRAETDLEHLGLIGEAGKLLASGDQKVELAGALRYGVRNPKPAIVYHLTGSKSEILEGLHILACFPELLIEYEKELRLFSTHTSEPIRNAAIGLLSTWAKK